jgi:hypothetical protein
MGIISVAGGKAGSLRVSSVSGTQLGPRNGCRQALWGQRRRIENGWHLAEFAPSTACRAGQNGKNARTPARPALSHVTSRAATPARGELWKNSSGSLQQMESLRDRRGSGVLLHQPLVTLAYAYLMVPLPEC